MDLQQLQVLPREQLEELHRTHVKYGTTNVNENILILEIAIALNLPEVWKEKQLWSYLSEVRKPTLETFVANHPDCEINTRKTKSYIVPKIRSYVRKETPIFFETLFSILRNMEGFNRLSHSEVLEHYRTLTPFRVSGSLSPVGLYPRDQEIYNRAIAKGYHFVNVHGNIGSTFTRMIACICAAEFNPREDRTPRTEILFRSEVTDSSESMFAEAIRGGYNENWPEVIKTIFQYPPSFDFVKCCEVAACAKHPESLVMIRPRLYSEYLTNDDRFKVVLKGFDEEQETFFDRLMMFNSCGTFGPFPSFAEVLVDLLKSPYFSECIAWVKGEITEEEIIERLELVVPAGMESREYVSQWLLGQRQRVDPSYIPLLDSSLSRATDRKIVDLFDSVLRYKNRNQLLKAAANAVEEKRFFRLRALRRNTNAQTTLLEDCEVSGMVGFGTDEEYRVYSFLELEGAFVTEASFKTYCRIPEDPRKYFSQEDIRSLMRLVKIEDNETLMLKLNDTILITSDSSDVAVEMLQQNPESGRNLLKQITDLGLYMRRWNGVQGEWPYSEEATRVEVDPEVEVTPRLAAFTEMLKQDAVMNDIFSGLAVYAPGVKAVSENQLKKYFNKVVQGSECIRMASARLIWTADLYSRLAYEESVYEGMDASQFVRVA